ncbi:phage repressor protein [Pantoea ananatis]|jgi:DNA polymerase V|uniref:phage repressor protein n=1 Tax=Pantoea ananas TaxID=553 RepID=UPI003FA47DF0
MTLPCQIVDCKEMHFDFSQVSRSPNDMMRIETPSEFVLVDQWLTLSPGKKVIWQINGCLMVGECFKGGIITEDGEAIDGKLLDSVVMLGVVVFEVLSVYGFNTPIV